MSQSSECSLPSLELSQETMRHLMGSVGMKENEGNVFTDCYVADFQNNDDEESNFIDDGSAGPSSISVRRAVFRHNDNHNMPWSDPLSQQSTGFGHPLPCSSTSVQAVPHNNGSKSPTPQPQGPPVYFSPPCLPSSSGLLEESPLLCAPSSIISFPLSHPSADGDGVAGNASLSGGASRSTIPINTTLEGDYGFKLECDINGKMTRSTTLVYSALARRAYIKFGATVPFNFVVNRCPPHDSMLRAMAIHTAPENIGENLTCCLKHNDENQKQGLIFPLHFIRPSKNDKQTTFHTDAANNRLSIVTPFSSLQKKSENCYVTLYHFPCYTSDFSKTGQYVQIIFTLERGHEVLGRCTLDIRVCASPSRDSNVNEKRKQKEKENSTADDKESEDPLSPPPPQSNGRKRGAPTNLTEVTKCVLPPKRPCTELSSQKVSYTIETYPEIIPYIDVCVRMMESVHRVPTTIATTPTTATTSGSAQEEPAFKTVESWLSHLGLGKYHKALQSNGISELFQVLSVTEEELKKWGVKNATHRRKFIDGKALIEVEAGLENSPDLFSQSPTNSTQPNSSSQQSAPPPASGPSLTFSQNSQVTYLHRTQSFEVVEITMKKNISSSSSTSSSSQTNH